MRFKHFYYQVMLLLRKTPIEPCGYKQNHIQAQDARRRYAVADAIQMPPTNPEITSNYDPTFV
jgi:hypothetical protein